MSGTKNDANETLRRIHESTSDQAVIWVDDGSGRVVDELTVETRIRPGTGGCQLCRGPLDGTERHGCVQFDLRGLPRLVFGPGEAICGDCAEWLRWLDHYAECEPISEPRFGKGDLVLRAGTEELYQVVDARLTGLPAAGVRFPAYACRRIEIGAGRGEVVPACFGLEFEFADFEIQPIPPRHAIPQSVNSPTAEPSSAIDLVGEWRPVLPPPSPPAKARPVRVAFAPRLLLPGKGAKP